MNEAPSSAELVLRLREGEPQAAEKLFTLYSAKLSRLAEQYLGRKMAGRLDGDDVVQSVFRTFFRRCLEGQFSIDSSSQLWRLLVGVTLRKVRGEVRFHSLCTS